MKQCTKCKETKPVAMFLKSKQNKTGFRSWCRNCDNENRNRFIKTKRGHINQTLTSIRSKAKQKNISFNLDLDFLESIATDICPIFKTPFNWGLNGKGLRRESPSLDKIIPKLGYIKGNVVFISVKANTIKQEVTETELYAVADWLHDARKKVLNAKKKSASSVST